MGVNGAYRSGGNVGGAINAGHGQYYNNTFYRNAATTWME